MGHPLRLVARVRSLPSLAAIAIAIAILAAGCSTGAPSPAVLATPAPNPTAPPASRPVLTQSPRPSATTTSRPTVTATPSATAAATSSPFASASPTALALPAGRTVSLVPMGSVPATTLQALAAFYLDKYGLRVAILKPAPINAASRDVGRRQLIGEELVTAMRSAYPKAAADPNAVLIGIVSEDLYVRVRPDWAWAFGLRTDGRFGVLSTARMSWPQGLASKTVQMTRLRKMVTRYIGQLYFRLPTNNVQGSVLYGTINGLYDLDRLGEDF